MEGVLADDHAMMRDSTHALKSRSRRNTRLCGCVAISGVMTTALLLNGCRSVACEQISSQPRCREDVRFHSRTNVVLLSDYEIAELRARAKQIDSDPTAALVVYHFENQNDTLRPDDAVLYLLAASGSLYSGMLEYGKRCLTDPTLMNERVAQFWLAAAASNGCDEAKELLQKSSH